MTEIWKDIEGYEGYQVSNLGRVRSIDRTVIRGGSKMKRKGMIRKPMPTNKGYLHVHIVNKPTIVVHRVVAKAFVPGYFEGAQVNHIDENKQNNRWDNLEWVTSKENSNFGTRKERLRNAHAKIHGKAVDQYSIDGKFIATYPSQQEAARVTGICQSNISHSVRKGKAVKGFIFKTHKTPPS